jgi:hypothetical protein
MNSETIYGMNKKTLMNGAYVLIAVIVVVVLIMVFKSNIQQFTDVSTDNQNKIIDNILNNPDQELDTLASDLPTNEFNNPLQQNINPDRNEIAGISSLQSLMREVNTGNQIPSNSEKANLYRRKARGRDSAKTYRNVSYKDSNYRMDFNGDGISQESQDKLDSMYNDSLVFHDSEYQNNNNYTGMPSNMDGDIYASAGLANFTLGPQTAEEKVASLYNSNNYLPNSNLTNPALTEGFQILENPTGVSNPNLIPVMKAMPVSSVLGSKRNSSLDLRGDPSSNSKTTVSPWGNSSIMPDIYSTNRGCL